MLKLGLDLEVRIDFCCTCGVSFDSGHHALGIGAGKHIEVVPGTVGLSPTYRGVYSDPSRPACTCGTVERMVDAGLPIVPVPLKGTWALDLGSNFIVPLTFCFSCGALVGSKNRDLETIPSEVEMQEAARTLHDVLSVNELEETLGPPDEVFRREDFPLRADTLQFTHQYIYTKKWNSFDLIAIEKTSGEIMFVYRPKIEARHA